MLLNLEDRTKMSAATWSVLELIWETVPSIEDVATLIAASVG